MKQFLLLLAVLIFGVVLILPSPAQAGGLVLVPMEVQPIQTVYTPAPAHMTLTMWPVAVLDTRTKIKTMVHSAYVLPLGTVSEVTAVNKIARIPARGVLPLRRMQTVTILEATRLPVRACTQGGSALTAP